MVIKTVTDAEYGNRESLKYCSQTYIVKQGSFHSCHVNSVFQSSAGKLMGTSTSVAHIFTQQKLEVVIFKLSFTVALTYIWKSFGLPLAKGLKGYWEMEAAQ